MKDNLKVKKIVLSGIYIAIATVLGTLSVPVFGGKMSPVQHFINVTASITLGPLYSVICAFITSILRNVIGTGSLLAFPGSMVGALVSGILYKITKKTEGALIGEIIGTGIIGSLLAYPVASLFMGKNVAVFTYLIPFLISCIGGAIIAYLFFKVPFVKKIIQNNALN